MPRYTKQQMEIYRNPAPYFMETAVIAPCKDCLDREILEINDEQMCTFYTEYKEKYEPSFNNTIKELDYQEVCLTFEQYSSLVQIFRECLIDAENQETSDIARKSEAFMNVINRKYFGL